MKALSLILLLISSYTFAKPPVAVKMRIERSEAKQKAATLIFPYTFSGEDVGTAIGVGVINYGALQPQMTTGVTAFTGDSHSVALGVWNYKPPGSERLFLSVMGMVGYYPLLRAYSPVTDDFSDSNQPRPGSNDSASDDYFAAAGASNWWEIKLDYVLPLGAAKHQATTRYQLTGGLLRDSHRVASWDPLTTGTSIVTLRQFNRYQRYGKGSERISGSTHAFELGLLYDNTDFPLNPTQGSSQYLAISHSPDWFNWNKNWTVVEAEASGYFDFGTSQYAKQRVLALNAWSAYSPSWEVEYNDLGESRVINNAPFHEGANLGGFYRMRGFTQNRFHDKAAIYTSAEYRYTLRYNPTEDLSWLRFLRIDWVQLVPFVEGGRVAPTYQLDTLLADWKFDAGLSFRTMMAGMQLRFDFAKSSEGTNAWLMIGHPF